MADGRVRSEMELYFVRHGRTAGNRESRYVGRTDEPLLPESLTELEGVAMPPVELVVASPMLRCRQTARALYPGVPLWIEKDLREMDFGDFEYKNYEELNGNPAYQAFIDSGGVLDFPGGEPLLAFKERCRRAFAGTMERLAGKNLKAAAFVVHGGTIMAILEGFASPEKGYFDWQIKNGAYIRGLWTGDGKIYVEKEIKPGNGKICVENK